jgi:hypothetical protein
MISTRNANNQAFLPASLKYGSINDGPHQKTPIQNVKRREMGTNIEITARITRNKRKPKAKLKSSKEEIGEKTKEDRRLK